MNDTFDRRLSTFVRTGWWMFALNYGLLLLSWALYRVFTASRPDWVLSLWGAHTDWPTVQAIWLGALVAYKLTAWAQFFVVLWATLWRRSLRRSAQRAHPTELAPSAVPPLEPAAAH
jgi:hypothetical protein